MPMMKMRDVRIGEAILYNNEVWLIFDRHEQTRGNLRTYWQIKLKHLERGNVVEQRFSPEDKVVQLEMPQMVEVDVTDAPEGARGDTATSVTKLATIETGSQVRVPGHIRKDDKIKIRVEDGEFRGRA